MVFRATDLSPRRRSANVDFSLTDAQVRSFHENGFLVVDFGIDDELIDAIVRGVAPCYPSTAPRPNKGVRAANLWKRVAAVQTLARLPQTLIALRQIFGRGAKPFQTLNFPVGTGQTVHSDTIHFNSRPRGYLAGVWVAFEDMDTDNGPLAYYPSSHRLPELDMREAVRLAPGLEGQAAYVYATRRIIQEHGLEMQLGLVRRGEAIIWHGNLLHGGHAQRDPSRSRNSQVTHYFFRGCRYYTPLHDRRRYPDWITDHPWHPLRPAAIRARAMRNLSDRYADWRIARGKTRLRAGGSENGGAGVAAAVRSRV